MHIVLLKAKDISETIKPLVQNKFPNLTGLPGRILAVSWLEGKRSVRIIKADDGHGAFGGIKALAKVSAHGGEAEYEEDMVLFLQQKNFPTDFVDFFNGIFKSKEREKLHIYAHALDGGACINTSILEATYKGLWSNDTRALNNAPDNTENNECRKKLIACSVGFTRRHSQSEYIIQPHIEGLFKGNEKEFRKHVGELEKLWKIFFAKQNTVFTGNLNGIIVELQLLKKLLDAKDFDCETFRTAKERSKEYEKKLLDCKVSEEFETELKANLNFNLDIEINGVLDRVKAKVKIDRIDECLACINAYCKVKLMLNK